MTGLSLLSGSAFRTSEYSSTVTAAAHLVAKWRFVSVMRSLTAGRGKAQHCIGERRCATMRETVGWLML
jgi:hypothetical protein